MVLEDILDASGDIFAVGSGQTAHRDSSVLGHVNVMLLHHGFTLSDRESGEREHTNLVEDVVPVALGLHLVEVLFQKSSHFRNSISDVNEFVQPLLSHDWVVQDHSSNSGTMEWWGRVVASHNNFNLGHNLGGGALVSADEMESSTSFSVETHDLGEGLGNDHFETLVEEVSEANTVLVQVSGDETLIGSVEEWVKVVLLADLGNSLPLVESWVDTSWVVSAGVQKNDGSWGSSLQVSDHTFEIKTLGLLVEISVLSDIHADLVEDLVVVSPGWVAQIDWSGSVLVKEISDDSESTSSRQSLEGGNSSTVDILVVPAEKDTSGTFGEVSDSVNWEVFLIQLVVFSDFLLSSSDAFEDNWLAIVVSVGTDSEVDLFGVLVSLVSGGQGENWISWSLLDMLELVVAESNGLLSFELVVEEGKTFHLEKDFKRYKLINVQTYLAYKLFVA